MASILEVRGVSKNFGEIQALSDISFTVNQGEFLGIIGPNGAGKTTLFNMITGFDRLSKGDVFFQDANITGTPPHKIVGAGVARTFQIPRPFHELTVKENVEISKPNKQGFLGRQNVNDILKRVGLWELREQPASNLPQGDLRRLEVARALATNPTVLMLDEPYAGLGPVEMSILTELLVDLNNSGLTIVIIEHKLKELMKILHRVVVLNYGKVIAVDEAGNIKNNKQVVEAYLGRGNW